MESQAQQKLWKQFVDSHSAELKRRLVLHYLDLVRYVVSKLGMQSWGNQHGLDRNDIVHYGVLGLVTAIDRFSPTAGVKFETYAIPRIRGAILDELRNLDWVPRSVREKTRELERVSDRIAQEYGREAVGIEIAEELNMSIEEYQKFISNTAPQAAVKPEAAKQEEKGERPLDQLEGDLPDPFEQLTDEESKGILVSAVERLPVRERTIVALYYYEGLRFSEIGRFLRISESRVSQIHSMVLSDLKRALLKGI